MPGSHDTSDPLAGFTTPPLGETSAQASVREEREACAKRVSDEIDESLRLQRVALKKEKTVVKVLLLGQAESGKSTTLKNFRMKYDTAAWQAERVSWRAVIQFNLVRAMTVILEAITAEANGYFAQDDERVSVEEQLPLLARPSFTEKHQLLQIRLSPLRGVETDLRHHLGDMTGKSATSDFTSLSATPFDRYSVDSRPKTRSVQFAVRSWRDALESTTRTSTTKASKKTDLNSVTAVLASCKDDMKALWDDEYVQFILAHRNIGLPDSASFFLSDISRITALDFEPSDDDIVRARLPTTGIQEHRLEFDFAPRDSVAMQMGREWKIYDVGGCRTMRHAWLPFFENINTILFLAPVSCFDERLEEDCRINRLEDSLLLWKSICSTRLLTKTQIILFLNKCDLLKEKLKKGVKVKTYLTSYGDRPNDVNSVVKYLRDKFKDIHQTVSPENRASYIYATTVTDTKATAKALDIVREGIIREHLIASKFL